MADYEYIESLDSYGHFHGDSFERTVESRREVWFGDDGSGLIRSQRIRSTFFTEEQRLKWESNAHSSRRDSLIPTLDVFAPGSFFGPRRRLANLAADPDVIAHELQRTRSLSLHGIFQLVGEALVPETLRHTFFDLAVSLPDSLMLEAAKDELGRSGIAVTREESRHREELIFDRDSFELVGYRQVLLDADLGYAPVGATIGWSAYLSRRLVDALPDGITLRPPNT